MNKELDALRRAMMMQHQKELALLQRHHHEDAAQIEALATTMSNRMSLMERLNSVPDEGLPLEDQLPRMTQNWNRNGGYQQ